MLADTVRMARALATEHTDALLLLILTEQIYINFQKSSFVMTKLRGKISLFQKLKKINKSKNFPYLI